VSDEQQKPESSDKELEDAYRRAHELLEKFLALPPPDRLAFVQALRPRQEDYLTLFIPACVRSAEIGYRALWGNSASWPAPPSDVEIHLAGARVEHFRARTGVASLFPGGYLDVAELLQIGPLWFSFQLVAGRSSYTYDGLVWLGEAQRFVWTPRPWKVLPRMANPNKIYEDY
jgi:hypothetical protein